jgi:multiple sugar transport system substrate-binding protein
MSEPGKQPASDQPGSGRKAELLKLGAASLVTLLVTLFVLHRVWGTPSSDPVGDCGEHDGLVVAAESDISLNNQRRGLISQWNGRPGQTHRATMVELGPSIDLLHSQLAAVVQARSCAYDVLVLDTPWTAEFAERGFVEPVKATWMEDSGDFFPQVMETVKWHGRQYAVPWTTDAGLLYLRDQTPAPESWDELLRTGYAGQLANYEGLTVNALEVIWNTGQPVLSGPVEEVDVETARVILAGLNSLAAGGGALPASRGWDEDAGVRAFVGKQAPIMRNWPRVFRALTADPRIGAAFEFRQLPRPSYSVLGGQSLAVSAYSKHKDEAGELIRFLTNRSAEIRLYTCGGYPPTRQSALGSIPTCADTKGQDPDTPTPQRLEQFTTILKAALQSARPRPVTPYYGQFSQTFRGCVNLVLDNKAPSPEALADALNAALEGRHGSCGGDS